jgi:hypothetical protein
MAQQVISPEEFIAEVNRRLPSHPAYTRGMHAFLVPLGADGKTATGYDWDPDGLATTGVVATVAAQVEKEFEINPYISRAPHT